MLTYNTHLKKLILPEYGRNIQRMVDICLTIEDKAERTQCAATIVKAMETLFPIQGDTIEYRRKLWDHLTIMSNFKLDVDVPFELIKAESLEESPTPLSYTQGEFNNRHYGVILQRAIRHAAAMEPGEERDALILLLANQMKKILLTVNADVEDVKVFKDLYDLSNGEIRLDPCDVTLPDFKVVAPATGKKKKKK